AGRCVAARTFVELLPGFTVFRVQPAVIGFQVQVAGQRRGAGHFHAADARPRYVGVVAQLAATHPARAHAHGLDQVLEIVLEGRGLQRLWGAAPRTGEFVAGVLLRLEKRIADHGEAATAADGRVPRRQLLEAGGLEAGTS